MVRAYHLEQPHAQSLFLFPIFFGINLIPFYDGKKGGAAVRSIICLWFLDDLFRHFERCETKRRKLFATESVHLLPTSALPCSWVTNLEVEQKCEFGQKKV